MLILEWLAQNLQHIAPKFGHLVEEENTVVCQRHLTRLWRLSATNEGYLRCQVVRGSERTLGYESLVRTYLTRYGVYLRGLECLLEGHRWQYGGHTACEHRLTRTWCAHHNDIMSSRSGNLEGALHKVLTLDIGKVLTVDILVTLLALGDDVFGRGVGHPSSEYLA